VLFHIHLLFSNVSFGLAYAWEVKQVILKIVQGAAEIHH